MQDLLTALKTLLGESCLLSDGVLQTQLYLAAKTIQNFCHIAAVPQALEGVQLTLALKSINRMGQEGSTDYALGGETIGFDELLTADLKQQLYAYRVVPKGDGVCS